VGAAYSCQGSEVPSKHVNDPDSEYPALLDSFKQAFVYTDCVGKGRWQTPEMVDEKHANWLVELADVMLGLRGDISEQQILDLQEMTKKGHVTHQELAEFMRKYESDPVMPLTDQESGSE
jgi:hypothetical protein